MNQSRTKAHRLISDAIDLAYDLDIPEDDRRQFVSLLMQAHMLIPENRELIQERFRERRER